MAEKIERMKFKAEVKGFLYGRVIIRDLGYGKGKGDILIEFYQGDRKCEVGDRFDVTIEPVKQDKSDVAKDR